MLGPAFTRPAHLTMGATTVNDAANILPLVLLVVVFIVLVVRPARARRRQFEGLQSQLGPGQQVMLASGIYGEIETIGDETLELRLAPGTVVKVNRHAVSRIIPPESLDEADD
jgi:preprotein translocase subunit YajC